MVDTGAVLRGIAALYHSPGLSFLRASVWSWIVFAPRKTPGLSWRALFRLHWAALIPAVMILVLSLLRVKVKLVMLAILLTEQLCRGLAEDQKQFANDLEDTTVIVAPLFPWSMAVAVPLATLGVPDGTLLCACYLYLLPLWRLGCSFLEKFQKKRMGKRAE